MSSPPIRVNLDIAVIGGGIAGLWVLNRLVRAGYQAALFESRALGGDQSLASQGMIHGGMKYTLNGALTGASEAIADMPRHWRACLCGEGDVDLLTTRILSDHFYLWSSESIASRLTTFLASKITRGRVDRVADEQRPPLLRGQHFSGSLYRLEDIVLDVPSLVANLAHNVAGHFFQLDWSRSQLHTDAQGEVSLSIDHEGQQIGVFAKQFIFTAGKGNGALLEQLGLDKPAMQLRPLQQVMVKHHYPHRFYGHCLGAETIPRLTISSHTTSYGAAVWYLGGSLAEKGAHQDAATLIACARQELEELIPWLDFSAAEWATLAIERAEPRQNNLARPEKAFAAPAEGVQNLLVGWPTKLTLAPNLANEVLDLLRQRGVSPGVESPALNLLARHLSVPPFARTPWDIAFPAPPPPELDDGQDKTHVAD